MKLFCEMYGMGPEDIIRKCYTVAEYYSASGNAVTLAFQLRNMTM